MSNILIREALSADLDPLVFLFDAYRQFYRFPPDAQACKNFLQQRFDLQDAVIYVAISPENNLSGFVQLYPLWSSTRLSRLWLLNDLYVKPEERGKGISKLLIGQCKQLAKQTNACGLQLETEYNNEIGNNLYRSEHFQLIKDNFYFWKNES